jgi:hypothetical protein
MVTAGPRKSTAFVIVLGMGMISVILLLYIGWVLLNWKHGTVFALSVLLLVMLLSGVAINTILLVREIRRQRAARHLHQRWENAPLPPQEHGCRSPRRCRATEPRS